MIFCLRKDFSASQNVAFYNSQFNMLNGNFVLRLIFVLGWVFWFVFGFLMQQVTCLHELNVYFLLDGTGCQLATVI